MQGYALAGLSALLSALAAVYTEWALKRNADSLYWQNMQLYSWGCFCNAAALTVNDLRHGACAWPLALSRPCRPGFEAPPADSALGQYLQL